MIVMIGMPIYRQPEPQTMLSLLGTVELLHAQNIKWHFGTYIGESVVAVARNQVAHSFRSTNATHLFWTDADVVWDPKDFVRVLQFAKKHPIVCAVYPTKTEPSSFQIAANGLDRDADGLLTINSTGLGFTCVQRAVIEKLADSAPIIRVRDGAKGEFEMRRIFHGSGEDQGEDKNFYADARAAGFSVKVIDDITLGHIGSKMYKGNLAEAMK